MASMGPRPCGRGRMADVEACALRLSLQWGHDLAAVEGGNRRIKEYQQWRLQWGHDLAAVEGAACRASTSSRSSFNGATTLRPWKGGGWRG